MPCGASCIVFVVPVPGRRVLCVVPASSACCVAAGCCSDTRCRRWSASRRSNSGPAGPTSYGSGASIGNDPEACISLGNSSVLASAIRLIGCWDLGVIRI